MSNPKPSSTRLFGALCAGGFLASLWALFQWGELLVARAGGTPFCSVSETFNCSAVWDSALAKAVHNATMVPVAGWGLMWGIVAFLLPLLALIDDKRVNRGLGAAIRITAVAGLASVVGLAAASLLAGHVCIGCMGTYVLVILWGVTAFMATKETGFAEPQKGFFWAGGLTLGSYLLLLAPGMMTPHALGDAGKDAIAKASAAAKAGDDANKGPAPDASNNPSASNAGPGPWSGPSTGDAAKDGALDELMNQLPADSKQLMSNLLKDYEDQKPAAAVPPPRVEIGQKGSTVTIVDWTDPMCPHCAELHAVLDQIRIAAPAGAMSIEPHFFPLDATCNMTVQRKDDTMGPIRCTAAKALLCLEDQPDKFALAQKLIFENQPALSNVDKVWEVLKPIIDQKSVEACMAKPETQKKLDDDIDAANKDHLEGTPLVLLNGKEVKPFGPILYALVLTGGKTHVDAFKVLPPPKPMPAQGP